MKTILVDVDRCVQCCNCQIACKDEHCGNDWSPIAAKQADGQFWVRIDQKEVSSGTRTRLIRMPILCQHCESPACMAACTHDAIYQREDGIVIIDPTKCQGCGDCQAACPYDVIYENAEAGIFQKCTMCAHLLDEGWEQPRCVTACPADALRFVDEADLEPQNFGAPLEKLHTEVGTKPRVTYLNLPRPFVGGEVYAPREDICLEDVRVTVREMVTGEVRMTSTNNYGDFSVEGLTPGFYALTFEKEGYFPKTISNVDVREPLNMEEIALYRKA